MAKEDCLRMRQQCSSAPASVWVASRSFGRKVRLRTLVEDRVLAEPEVYAGGGAVDAVLRIAPPELVRTTAAEIINLSS